MKFIREKLQSRFYRYLLTYLGIFLLPFVVSLLFFQIYIAEVYREEVMLNQQERNHQIGLSLDANMAQLGNVFSQIRLSDTFNQGAAEDTYHQISMMRELHMLRAVNEMLHEVVYYQKNLDTVISSRNVIQQTTVEQFHFRYTQWERPQMLQHLYSSTDAQWRPFEPVVYHDRDELQIMSCSFPVGQVGKYNSSVIQFHIEKKNFEGMLGLTPEADNTFVIIDRNGGVFYSSRPLDGDLQRALTSIPYTVPQTLEVQNVLVSVEPSLSTTGWYYVNLLPTRIAMAKTASLQGVYLAFVCALLLTGVVIIYFVANRSYRPYRELINLLNDKDCTPSKMDEVERARMTIGYLSAQNDDLELRIRKGAIHAREGLLRRMLQGQYKRLADFNVEGEPYGLRFTNPFLFVMTLVEGEETYEGSAAESLLRAQYEAQELRMFDTGYVVLLCSTQSSDPNILHEQLMETQQMLHAAKQHNLRVGSSTATSDTAMLRRKYIEAMTALESTNAIDTPISFYGRSGPHCTIHYPNEEVEIMRRAAKEGDSVLFINVYQSLRRYLDSCTMPTFMAVCVCYDVINALIKCLIDMDDSAASSHSLEQYTLLPAQGGDAVAQLSQVMDQLKDRLMNWISPSGSGGEMQLERIKEYIAHHFLDQDFSVQKIADEFCMSLSGLSAYFKSRTDTTLTHHILMLKMNYALQLMKNKELGLNEIALTIGYANASSFARKFKQYMGMTPGEYKATFQHIETKKNLS